MTTFSKGFNKAVNKVNSIDKVKVERNLDRVDKFLLLLGVVNNLTKHKYKRETTAALNGAEKVSKRLRGMLGWSFHF